MAVGTLSIMVSSSGCQPKIKFRVLLMHGRGQLFFSFEDLFAAASWRNVWGEASGRGTQVAHDEALGAGCFIRTGPPANGEQNILEGQTFSWLGVLVFEGRELGSTEAHEAKSLWVIEHGVSAVMMELLRGMTRMPIEEGRRERWVANVKQLLLWFGPAVLDLDRGLADALPGGAEGGGAASGRGREPIKGLEGGVCRRGTSAAQNGRRDHRDVAPTDLPGWLGLPPSRATVSHVVAVETLVHGPPTRLLVPSPVLTCNVHPADL